MTDVAVLATTPRDGVTDQHAARALRGTSLRGRLYGATLLSVTFTAGMLCGFVTDGAVSVVNAFKSAQACASPSTYLPPPATIIAAKDAGRPEPYPENNAARWTISVTPGSDIGPVEVRNNSMSTNARLAFTRDGQTAPAVLLWVRAGSLAHVSLPDGRYRINALATAVDRPHDPSDPDLGPESGTVDVGGDSPQPVLVGSGDGLYRVLEGTSRTVKSARRSHRSNTSGEEYEGLGTSAKTGGTSTYGTGSDPT